MSTFGGPVLALNAEQPWAVERSARWRRRLHSARNDLLPTLLAVLIGAALLALGLGATLQLLGRNANELSQWLNQHRWSGSWMLAALCWSADVSWLRRMQRHRQLSWLRALSRPADWRAEMRRNWLIRAGLRLLLVLVIALTLTVHSAPLALPTLLTLALSQALVALGLLLSQLRLGSAAVPADERPAASVEPLEFRGALSAWARRRIWTAWRGSRAALWLGGGLLLIPSGANHLATLAMFGLVLALALAVVGWQTSASGLLSALRWLQVQPTALQTIALRYLRGALPPVLSCLGAAALLGAALGMAPVLAVASALLLLSAALLHGACLAAWWRQPRRAQAMWLAALVLLIALLRDAPALAAAAAPLMLLVLFRRIRR